ncbi:MAG TPA: hypothetical protein VJ826_08105, partial [Candidatus Polarisedimenticolaceae bacterium]|nr:hypothetical protein [Candidatus Polarisedimenticolaceae bacterium]
MTKEASIRSGDLIDLFDEGDLVSAVVVGEEKGRLKVVTEHGKELRVTASRVAHRAAGGASAARPAETASDHSRAAKARLPEIDLTVVWELLVEEPRRQGLGQLAALALGEDSPVARSAMLRSLQMDHVYFIRKADEYEPRPRDLVEETLRRQAAERLREERRAAFVQIAGAAYRTTLRAEGARAAAAGGLVADLTRFSDHVADLVEVALTGEEAPSRKDAVAVLDEAGVADGPAAERAFLLLVALGVFHEDENLFIHRNHLRRSFPEEVEQWAARSCAAVAASNLLEADGAP